MSSDDFDHFDSSVAPFTGRGHVDPEVLVLRALGERPGGPAQVAAVDAHLGSCAACQVELDQFEAVAKTARSVSPDDTPTAPPPEVWDAIALELGISGSVTPAPVSTTAPRRRTWVVAVAAAVVGVLVGGGIAYRVATPAESPAPGPATTVVATASLDPLKGATAWGTAKVVSQNSQMSVQVDVTGLAAPSGFYEVWLLDKDAKRLVALGSLNAADSGTFTMPPDVSLAQYPIVDISLEPADGNPGHSGDSIVRGTFPA